MLSITSLRERLARLELRCLRSRAPVWRLPVLRLCSRRLTADIAILSSGQPRSVNFQITFRTPYFRLPVSVEQDQIGKTGEGGAFRPAAFRLFDWHSWDHIDGETEWLGSLSHSIEGMPRTFVNGFRYRTPTLPSNAENLGLRLAEGVEGTARVLLDDTVEQIPFEPSYWMLEPEALGYRVVPIVESELMVGVVSLADLGSNSIEMREQAVDRLAQWVGFTLASLSRERQLVELLRHVRDWGPLGRPHLFGGLLQLLKRLGLEGQEQVMFEFFADNWGIRDNWHGRWVAIRLLEAEGTDRARAALRAIYEYVRNRDIPVQELALIRTVLHSLEGSGFKATSTLGGDSSE